MQEDLKCEVGARGGERRCYATGSERRKRGEVECKRI